MSGTELRTKTMVLVVKKKEKKKKIFVPLNSPSTMKPNHVAFQHVTPNINPYIFKGMYRNLDHASAWW